MNRMRELVTVSGSYILSILFIPSKKLFCFRECASAGAGAAILEATEKCLCEAECAVQSAKRSRSTMPCRLASFVRERRIALLPGSRAL